MLLHSGTGAMDGSVKAAIISTCSAKNVHVQNAADSADRMHNSLKILELFLISQTAC